MTHGKLDFFELFQKQHMKMMCFEESLLLNYGFWRSAKHNVV